MVYITFRGHYDSEQAQVFTVPLRMVKVTKDAEGWRVYDPVTACFWQVSDEAYLSCEACTEQGATLWTLEAP